MSSHSVGRVFPFWRVSFAVQKFSSLMECHLFTLLMLPVLFRSNPKYHARHTMSSSPPCFLLGVLWFQGSGLSLLSILSWLLSINTDQISSLAYEYPLFSIQSIEETSLLHYIFFIHFLKISLLHVPRLIPGLSILFHFYIYQSCQNYTVLITIGL